VVRSVLAVEVVVSRQCLVPGHRLTRTDLGGARGAVAGVVVHQELVDGVVRGIPLAYSRLAVTILVLVARLWELPLVLRGAALGGASLGCLSGLGEGIRVVGGVLAVEVVCGRIGPLPRHLRGDAPVAVRG